MIYGYGLNFSYTVGALFEKENLSTEHRLRSSHVLPLIRPGSLLGIRLSSLDSKPLWELATPSAGKYNGNFGEG